MKNTVTISLDEYTELTFIKSMVDKSDEVLRFETTNDDSKQTAYVGKVEAIRKMKELMVENVKAFRSFERMSNKHNHEQRMCIQCLKGEIEVIKGSRLFRWFYKSKAPSCTV